MKWDWEYGSVPHGKLVKKEEAEARIKELEECCDEYVNEIDEQHAQIEHLEAEKRKIIICYKCSNHVCKDNHDDIEGDYPWLKDCTFQKDQGDPTSQDMVKAQEKLSKSYKGASE